MTLFEVEELTRYWLDYPPLHLILAAHLGFKQFPRGRAKTFREPMSDRRPPAGDVRQLTAELGAGFASGDVHAGLNPVVLDFAELRRTAAAR